MLPLHVYICDMLLHFKTRELQKQLGWKLVICQSTVALVRLCCKPSVYEVIHSEHRMEYCH